MNASLRRISVTVMALIVLLLLNATMTQVFTADGLRADPRNQRVLLDEYSRQRGQITAGGQLLAYSVATDGRFRFLRVYPNPEVYAPVTGFYSLRYSSTALERAEDPILNGSDRRLFGRRLADFFTGRDPRGGNVDTTINPRIQQAAFVQLGIRTGADALRSMARAFGLDSPPRPTPLQVAESTVGPIPDSAALGMTSIGQKDVALTPLANAEIAATIANGGITMRPYLVGSLKGPDLANISTTVGYQQRRAVSPQVAAKLTELMVGAEKVAQQKGAIPGVQIASKTGTAEHGTDPRHTPPHAWYIAFAPAQAPKVAVAVLVENGADRLSATGGALAAPIGRAVIEAALQGEP